MERQLAYRVRNHPPNVAAAMTPFDFVAVALSIVLGLGITELLSSSVRVFLHRKEIELDWIPFAWGLSILAVILQYWWAFFDLSVRVPVWTPAYFVFLFVVLGTLYVAAALVIPDTAVEKGEGMRVAFERHGKWAVTCLSVYVLLILVVNSVFWGGNPFEIKLSTALQWTLIAAAGSYPFLSSRKAQSIVTVAWLIIIAYLCATHMDPYGGPVG